MARVIRKRDISPILTAAERWIKTCLIGDGSIFSREPRWTETLTGEIYQAFVEHPDYGSDDFMTKLKGQLKVASPSGHQLMAEMLWALLLFPSKIKAGTKRRQIREIWSLSGNNLPEDHELLADNVLVGIGSGGPGFNTYRPDELTFLLELTRTLKQQGEDQRKLILTNYDAFIEWINSVPQKGNRQFRHMLRFFAFPDNVERMSSNNDRYRILEAFEVAPSKDIERWTDKQLDRALLELRKTLQANYPLEILDFYELPLREKWSRDRKITTTEGEIAVTVPVNDEEQSNEETVTDVRESIRIQARLAEIGALMGLRVWIPSSDRSRVLEQMDMAHHHALLDSLPFNSDENTVDTVKQIDVLWFRGRSIIRAFEVEHTTAVYSGLLRMADLVALQPNMQIRLHIVAPDERREKVFREIKRPVFSVLEGGALSHRCTFISYENVNDIRGLPHLGSMKETIIEDFEEPVDS
jgi:hypothetical protein